VIDGLPGHGDEQEARAHDDRDRGKREITEAGEPASGQECVEQHVGMVEGSARPSVQDEHIGDAAEEVKITGEGGKRSSERGCKMRARPARAKLVKRVAKNYQ
jgi:hypothetical protein